MLRLLLTPRWLARTALAVVVAGVLVRLGVWQLDTARSAGGRGTNWAYAVEWWIFAAFVFFVLWHWLKDSVEREQRAAPGGSADGRAAGEADAADAAAAEPPPDALPRLARRPAPAPPATAQDTADDPELAAYNAYLARLHEQSTRGRRR